MKDTVQEYYGKLVQKTSDLEYDACCTTDYDPKYLEALTAEVKSKRYGCGSPVPDILSGLTVLDLGCGAGADVFIAAQLVGPAGKVIGVDMTDEQLAIARKNTAPIMENLGYDRPNVQFLKGEIESLELEDNSIDCAISNCVINLSTDKTKVFKELYRVLKPGGEFLISDIVADRRIPQRLRSDGKLYSECLTGADYENDFTDKMREAGFNDVRKTLRRKLGDTVETIGFSSITYRGFKITMEERCEDYGQVALYQGTIPESEASYTLDLGHIFKAGEAVRVCKNTADILKQSRLAPFFHVSEEIAHLGIFDCSHDGGVNEKKDAQLDSGSCC